MTAKRSPTARRTASQTSMSTLGSVGGWVLYAVQPSALNFRASSAYASFEARTAELALAAEPAGVPAVGGRRNIGPGEEGQRDVGDLHEGLPPFISISVPPGRVSVVIAPSGAARAHRRRAPKPRARARRPSRLRRRTRPATTRGVASRTGARVRR